MSEQTLPTASRPAWASFEAVEQAGEAARAIRIAQGEIMTYVVAGWVIRE